MKFYSNAPSMNPRWFSPFFQKAIRRVWIEIPFVGVTFLLPRKHSVQVGLAIVVMTLPTVFGIISGFKLL